MTKASKQKIEASLEELAASLPARPKGKPGKPLPASKAEVLTEIKGILGIPEDGSIPAFLKRTETAEQAEARRAKYAGKSKSDRDLAAALDANKTAGGDAAMASAAPKKRKAHPADVAGLDQIGAAKQFVVSIFRDRAFQKEEFKSLAEARERARAMTGDLKGGRRPMIYALLPDGSQALVPSDYQPNQQESKMASKAITKAKVESKKQPALKPAASKGKAEDKAKRKAEAAQAARKPVKAPTTKSKAVPSAKRRTEAAEIAEAARNGKMPAMPHLTHKSYAKHAEALAKLAKGRDLAGIKSYEPTFAEWLEDENYCSFRTPVARYRKNLMAALSHK